MAEYAFETPAKVLYDHGSMVRNQVIEMARRMARITIPSVYPPAGYIVGSRIGENNQSLNALLVNTMASKLMYLALPPDRPVLKFQPIVHKLQAEATQNPGVWTAIQTGLANLEEEHRTRFEATQMRSAYVSFTKQLIVAGNACWEHIKLNHPVVHRMDNYIVWRNYEGEQLGIILKKCLMWRDLDDDLKEMCLVKHPELKDQKDYERSVDFYACQRRCKSDGSTHAYSATSSSDDLTNPAEEYHWEYWEEFEDGDIVSGSELETDFETPPLFAGWMIPVYGSNWGRSYCEEYEGDLMSTEGLSAAMNDGASLAALSLLFVKPGSRTNAKQLKKAENLSVMTGSAEDITMFKTDKHSDFQFVDSYEEKVSKRLGRAFLLVSSVQRDAERVTAEEWKMMVKEINEATGGLYSELAQSVQTYVIRRAVALHNAEDKQLPKLPEGIFRVAVITGFEATGRTQEMENLVGGLGDIGGIFKEGGLRYIRIGDAVRRILVGRSVRTEGLIKTDDDIAGEDKQMQNAQMMQNAVKGGVGPAVTAFAKGQKSLGQNVSDQQQQQAQNLGQQQPLPPSTPQQ